MSVTHAENTPLGSLIFPLRFVLDQVVSERGCVSYLPLNAQWSIVCRTWK